VTQVSKAQMGTEFRMNLLRMTQTTIAAGLGMLSRRSYSHRYRHFRRRGLPEPLSRAFYARPSYLGNKFPSARLACVVQRPEDLSHSLRVTPSSRYLRFLPYSRPRKNSRQGCCTVRAIIMLVYRMIYQARSYRALVHRETLEE